MFKISATQGRETLWVFSHHEISLKSAKMLSKIYKTLLYWNANLKEWASVVQDGLQKMKSKSFKATWSLVQCQVASSVHFSYQTCNFKQNFYFLVLTLLFDISYLHACLPEIDTDNTRIPLIQKDFWWISTGIFLSSKHLIPTQTAATPLYC